VGREGGRERGCEEEEEEEEGEQGSEREERREKREREKQQASVFSFIVLDELTRLGSLRGRL